MAEAGGDWFRDIVRAMFGCVDRATMIREIVELLLLVPKKNNKTTGGALLMLTALVMNQRPRAPFALMAPVQDTAEEAFAAAEGAIALDPVLEKLFHVRSHLKTIIHRETKADLQIMTFDPDVLTGKKFVGTLIDELHVIAKNAKAAKALRQVRGGMVPFPEAFLAFITTMPDDTPTGVMKAELAKARNIRDGKAEGKMLPVLYEFPREMQKDKAVWTDPANWPMVNPNLGRSVTVQKLIELYEDAAPKGEEEVRGWASQHLNIEIGLGLMSDRWAGADHWQACAIETGLTLDELLSRSEVVTVGIDGGGLDDLLGFGALGRETETGAWLHWGHAWAHRCVLERRKEIAPRLLDFEKDGDLTIIDDSSEDDISDVADLVERIETEGLLDRVGVDPIGIGAIVDAIVDRKIAHERILGIPQGYKMVGAIKTAERKVAARTLRHGGSALMAWCCGNAKVVPAGNAVMITKQAAGTAKIDPLMALFNATSLMSMNPKPRRKKYQFFTIG